MDSELKSRISVVVEQLAKQEQQRLKAAGTFIELEELACEIGDEVTQQMLGSELADRCNRAADQTHACPTCNCPAGKRPLGNANCSVVVAKSTFTNQFSTVAIVDGLFFRWLAGWDCGRVRR